MFDLDDSDTPFDDDCVGSDFRVVHIVEQAQMIGLSAPDSSDSPGTSPVIYTMCADTNQMMDTGANCCITNNILCLVDVESITPFAVGVAVSGDTVAPSLCTKRGFIPLPMPNGDHCFQWVYYNENATDTIMSPNAICDDSRGQLVR